MSVLGSLHLAWQYIARHRVSSFLLALALGLTLGLPLFVGVFANIAGEELRSRSEATPLVLGAKGSALELALHALYFRRHDATSFPFKQSQTVQASGLADVIPVYARFQSQGAPIIGTTLDYFSFRKLHIAEGKMLTRLGDCVVGAKLARARGLKAGDALYSSPEQVFDIAGTYPLKMRVTGVIAENHSVDDEAIFTDVKTAWLIEGIAHGHDDLVKASESTLLEKQPGNVVANKSVSMFNEVTDSNFASFHFHGDAAEFPLSAAIVLPRNAKSQAILLGRYQNKDHSVQLVKPGDEMDALLATFSRIKQVSLTLLSALGVVVLLISALVFSLSFKMRRKEFATLEDIGISRSTVALVKFFEILIVGATALALAAIVWWFVIRYGSAWVRLGVS